MTHTQHYAIELGPTGESEARSRFERLVTNLSARFIQLAPEAADAEISDALKSLAEFLDVERTVLLQRTTDGTQFRNTHHWVANVVDTLPAAVDVQALFPYVVARALRREVFSFSSLDELPPEAAIDKASFAKYGSQSNLTLPLFAGDEFLGSLTFATIRRQRQWPPDLVDRLEIVGHVFAGALARARADLSLREAYAEVTKLKEQLEADNEYLLRELGSFKSDDGIVGQSAAIKKVLRDVNRVGPTDSTVLLFGETGTGKELVAEATHRTSKRRDRLLVRVNCAALPAGLVESELFGRERGAYTGALSREAGRFEAADGGTLFLDEVSELPLDLQAKLLRVLETGSFERLGSSRTISVDVRLVAATNRHLEEAVRDRRFREDLFFRLNVFPIEIPPLRERREDIPLLVWSFVKQFGQQLGKVVETIPHRSMEALKNYP
jgi:formate hydrogenlyase transcriptional activator